VRQTLSSWSVFAAMWVVAISLAAASPPSMAEADRGERFTHRLRFSTQLSETGLPVLVRAVPQSDLAYVAMTAGHRDEDVRLLGFGPQGEKRFRTSLFPGNEGLALGLSVDPAGRAWVCGGLYPYPEMQAFVACVDEAGIIRCSQTFEGFGSAYLTAIDTDEAGNVYAAGQTWGPGDEYESTPFLLKLDAKGDLLAFRANEDLTDDGSWDSLAASNQAVFVAGSASTEAARNLPGATFIGPGGLRDVVLSQIDSDDLRPLSTTVLGGDRDDLCGEILIAPEGDVVLAGSTTSLRFPHGTIWPNDRDRDYVDAFVAVFHPGASRLRWLKRYVYQGWEWGYGIALGPDDNLFLCGQVVGVGGGFKTDGGLQRRLQGTGDPFVAEISRRNGALRFSTFLGAWAYTKNSTDLARSIAVGPDGAIHVGGYTLSGDFPVYKGHGGDDFGYRGFYSVIVDGQGSGSHAGMPHTVRFLAFNRASFSIYNRGQTTLMGQVGQPYAPFSILSGGGLYAISPGGRHDVTLDVSPDARRPYGWMCVTSTDPQKAVQHVFLMRG
jgi:hypothetical protein